MPAPVRVDAGLPGRLLAREDEGYVVGVVGRDGQYLPGKAAKWHASERLMGWMEEMRQGEEMVVDDEQDPAKKSILLDKARAGDGA